MTHTGEPRLNTQLLISRVQHIKNLSAAVNMHRDVTDVLFVSVSVTFRSLSDSVGIMRVSRTRNRVKWTVQVTPQEHKIAAV